MKKIDVQTMTEEKAIELAKRFGLEEEIKTEIANGIAPERALFNRLLIARYNDKKVVYIIVCEGSDMFVL